jgi:hypothetical protein
VPIVADVAQQAIFPNSSAELAPMRAALAKDAITLDPKANYLQ